MTGFMLDTDISSYIIKRRPATLVEKFEKHSETLNVSVITARGVAFWRGEGGSASTRGIGRGLLGSTGDFGLDR